MKSFLQFLLFLLLIVLALAGLYAWKSGWFEGDQASVPTMGRQVMGAPRVPGLAALDEEMSRVCEAVIPSVVSITPQQSEVVDPREDLMRQFFGLGRPPTAGSVPSGSGAIVSAEGHIVTNLHVIQGAEEVVVGLADGRRFPARLLGTDDLTDVAVLKIEVGGLRPLAFADSEKARVGQMVFAVGSPYGLVETVTMGIISARERLFAGEVGTEFFQTDAAINRGNSGGPLINIHGEIIGINNFIITDSGGSQGIAFSTPSNSVRRVLEQILEHGRVLRPQLGVVSLNMIDPALAGQLGLPDTRGAFIEAVLAGSPAQEAGLRKGDVIRRFGGREVHGFNDLRKLVADGKIGGETPMEILRDGRKEKLSVRLSEFHQRAPANQAAAPAGSSAFGGVTVADVTPELAARHLVPSGIRGVLVQAVAHGSPASRVLQPGDVIEQLNGRVVVSARDFASAVRALPPGDRVMLVLWRGQKRVFEEVNP